jgi:hypothetical protein
MRLRSALLPGIVVVAPFVLPVACHVDKPETCEEGCARLSRSFDALYASAPRACRDAKDCVEVWPPCPAIDGRPAGAIARSASAAFDRAMASARSERERLDTRCLPLPAASTEPWEVRCTAGQCAIGNPIGE